jgi:hypothetical protein
MRGGRHVQVSADNPLNPGGSSAARLKFDHTVSERVRSLLRVGSWFVLAEGNHPIGHPEVREITPGVAQRPRMSLDEDASGRAPTTRHVDCERGHTKPAGRRGRGIDRPRSRRLRRWGSPFLRDQRVTAGVDCHVQLGRHVALCSLRAARKPLRGYFGVPGPVDVERHDPDPRSRMSSGVANHDQCRDRRSPDLVRRDDFVELGWPSLASRTGATGIASFDDCLRRVAEVLTGEDRNGF